MARRSLKERFLDKVFPEPNSGCWLWTGGVTSCGYGTIKIDYVTKTTHRTSYRLFKGEINDGLLVLHKCDTPCCVNPDHLFLGTAKENSDDMIRKNRKFITRGELSGNAKLKEADVIKIRTMSQYKNIELAKMFNVSDAIISRIRSHKRWAHLK